MAQFTSQSKENLASGMAGPSSSNHVIKTWSLTSPGLCSFHSGLLLGIIRKQDGASRSRLSSLSPTDLRT